MPDIKYPEDCQFLDNDNYLIISSQGDNALVAYPFNKLTGRISSNPKLIKNPNARLSFPHGIGLSSDGKWLVAANYGDDSFNLYSCS